MIFDLLKKATSHYEKGLPFVLYRKPDEDSVIGLFQNTNQLFITSDYKGSGFVFAPYATQGKTILLMPDEMSSAAYIVPKKKIRSFKLPPPDDHERKRYLDRIARALVEIKEGRLEKVVLSRKIEFSSAARSFSIFQEILALYPKAFCYLWYHPKVGVWSGASPETFVNICDSVLTTMALAGTQMSNNHSPPVWGSKEVEEQAVVTSYILEALSDKVRNLNTSKSVSVRAGNLWHLKTTISGVLDGISLKTIIEALHPTPAVCGIPVKEAKIFLSQNENYNREYYTGFLGELNLGEKKQTQLFVNLRCLQIQGNTAILYIGGGITSGSVPEDEWQETLDKTGIMARALFNSKE